MARRTKQGEPAANRKKDILEASLRLFAEKGLKGASMRGIARAAGLTEGTLYHYFSGKDQIVAEIVAQYGFSGRDVKTAFAETGGPLRARLAAVGEDFLAVLGANPHVTAFLLSEGVRYPVSPPEAGSPAYEFYNLIRRRSNALADLIAAELADSADQVDSVVAAVAHFFNALSGFWLTELFLAGRTPTPDEQRAYLTDLVNLLTARLTPRL